MMTERETLFLEQAKFFLERVREERGVDNLSEFQALLKRRPFPIEPVIVENYLDMQKEERTALLKHYDTWGMAYFVIQNPEVPVPGRHPLFEIAEQLKDDLNLHYPLDHPHDSHAEAIKRFGIADSTFKVYNLPKPVNGPQYREIAETNEPSEAHSDGLGMAGAVETSIMYGDSPPMFGGYTFFYDTLSLGAVLAQQDYEAFQSLFLPDAMISLRPRGKGAIKVVTPVLYINESGKPQTAYRRPCGEYYLSWRENCPPLDRAHTFLQEHTEAFCYGSFFVSLRAKGHGCLVNNRRMSHGRTGFIDGQSPSQTRCLSRKWFMTSKHHSKFKHVPGTNVHPKYARLFPEYFGPEQMEGRWLYNQKEDRNVRVA